MLEINDPNEVPQEAAGLNEEEAAIVNDDPEADDDATTGIHATKQDDASPVSEPGVDTTEQSADGE